MDPRKYATADVGRRNVELAAQALGKKARELLDSLSEVRKTAKPPVITPGQWWMI